MGYNDREEIIARRRYDADIHGSTEDLIIASPTSCAAYVADKIAKPGVRIAEFCCGIGITTLACAKRGEFVYGIDASDDCVQATRANLRAADIGEDMFVLATADISDPAAYDGIQADIAMYDIPYWYDKLDQNPDYAFVVDQILDKVCSRLIVFSPPGFVPPHDGAFVRESIIANDKPDRDLLFYGFDTMINASVNL